MYEEYEPDIGATTEGDSILDIDTSDAREPIAVEPGEYKIRITGQRKDNEGKIIRESQNGNRYFIITFDIPDEINSKGLSKIFSVPSDDMEPKKINAIKWDLECFKRAFNLDEINFNSMIGREGYAILRKTFSEEYGYQNEISKFVTGA